MAHWIRFSDRGVVGIGTLEGGQITVHQGDLFENPRPTGQTVELAAVKVLTPTVPGKMVALVNNFRALVAKLNQPVPAEPLYFLKANNSFLAHGEVIRRPASYPGMVVYEGELGT